MTTYICVECLGTMTYSDDKGYYICSHCGNDYEPVDDIDTYTDRELACTGCYGPCGMVCGDDSSRYAKDGEPF